MFTSPGFNKQNSRKGFEGPFRSAPAYYWWYLEKLMLCVETVFFYVNDSIKKGGFGFA